MNELTNTQLASREAGYQDRLAYKWVRWETPRPNPALDRRGAQLTTSTFVHVRGDVLMARPFVLTCAGMHGTGEPDGLWQPEARK